jgi:hypothetical protein
VKLSVTCPRCGGPTIRTASCGRPPYCDSCHEEVRRRRLEVQREKRRSGERGSNRDANGVRYDAAIPDRAFKCHYCSGIFMARRLRHKIPVCPACLPEHRSVVRRRRTDRVIAAYSRDPAMVLRRRMGNRLEQIGLSLEWYDSHQACGICKTTDPGGRGGWHIDHDHSCCPGEWWQSCGKCIRGLLCHHCNIGMGNFSDDPQRLLAAVAWIAKKGNAA